MLSTHTEKDSWRHQGCDLEENPVGQYWCKAATASENTNRARYADGFGSICVIVARDVGGTINCCQHTIARRVDRIYFCNHPEGPCGRYRQVPISTPPGIPHVHVITICDAKLRQMSH